MSEDELIVIAGDDPLFIDVVTRIAKALAPLKPKITEEVVDSLDAFAHAVIETIERPQ